MRSWISNPSSQRMLDTRFSRMVRPSCAATKERKWRVRSCNREELETDSEADILEMYVLSRRRRRVLLRRARMTLDNRASSLAMTSNLSTWNAVQRPCSRSKSTVSCRSPLQCPPSAGSTVSERCGRHSF